LVDHREDLVSERTAISSRLRWHLHDLASGLEPFARTLNRDETRRGLSQRLGRYAAEVQVIAGVGDLVAARMLVEIGGATRFSSDAALARHAGCAPIEVSSGRSSHCLSRLGNRKLNASLHVVVLTQARVHPPARAYLAKKRAEGKSNKEAFRCLKRHLVRVVWRTLQEPMEATVSVPSRRGTPSAAR
jgi:transposase